MQFKENQTIHSQIEEYLKRQIFTGAYNAGDRLPAIRELAVFCKVNPNTIVKVYENLEREGLVYSERTAGKFVTQDEELIKKTKSDFISKEVKEFIKSIQGMTNSAEDIIKYIKENYGDIKY